MSGPRDATGKPHKGTRGGDSQRRSRLNGNESAIYAAILCEYGVEVQQRYWLPATLDLQDVRHILADNLCNPVAWSC
jgi:hypothetical protein